MGECGSWEEEGEGARASGVAGRPPMDSHSPAELRADGGEQERTSLALAQCVCVYVCVCARACGGRGAN